MDSKRETHTYPGKFVVFEGLDGSGQTTQAHRLKDWYSKHGALAHYTKEPTQGPIGSLLRLILSRRLVSRRNRAFEEIDEDTIALLFAADRMDHINSEIIPRLAKGIVVIGDRYYLSSLAYQSLGSNYNWIKKLNSKCLVPDLTVFLDVPPEICRKRVGRDRERWHLELYEDMRKLAQIREYYLRAIEDLANEAEPIEVVDGTGTIAQVHGAILGLLKQYAITIPRKARETHESQLPFAQLTDDTQVPPPSD